MIGIAGQVWSTGCKVWNEWYCLTNEIHHNVRIGIIIHNDGDHSKATPCFRIDLNHNNNFITARIIAVTINNIEKNIAIAAVGTIWDIAAGHANHTHTIEKANIAIIWDSELLFTKSKSHSVISLVK